jgi:hypothetical protein
MSINHINNVSIGFEFESHCGLFINEENKEECFTTCNNWILDLMDSIPDKLVKPNSQDVYEIKKSTIDFNDLYVELNKEEINDLREEFQEHEGTVSAFYILKRLSKLYLSDILYIRNKLKTLLSYIVLALNQDVNSLSVKEKEDIVKSGHYTQIQDIVNLLDVSYIKIHQATSQESKSANNLVNILKLYYACYNLRSKSASNKHFTITLELNKPYFALTTEIGEFEYKKTPTRSNFFLGSNWIIDGNIITLSIKL